MTSPKKQLNLAIVDDHNLFRKGLIKLIGLADKENKYNILFEAENGLDLTKKIDKAAPPDIVLMDIDMPEMDGYETVNWLNKNLPGIAILVISMFETEEPILKMLRLGIKGFLSKDIEVEDMYNALEAIGNKGLYYSEIASGVATHALQGGDTNADTASGSKVTGKGTDLSPVERQFVELACTELTYQQIADQMHLSPKTIDGYRDNLFRRLNVKSRVGLAMYAVKHGLVKL